MQLHHVGIQTASANFDSTLQWYAQLFERGSVNWTLDCFSNLTQSRLPGISRLVEFQIDGLRLHIFDRDDGVDRPLGARWPQFQHVGIAVSSADELHRYRDRWIELSRSGQFSSSRWSAPSEVVFDVEGVGSLYVQDVNGLEIEFTYVPDGMAR